MNICLSDIIEWDVVNWSSALQFWEKNSNCNLSHSLVLEIGAGNGGLSLWLASKGCKVICSDLNDPIQKAYELHKKYQVLNRIEYQVLDATNIPYREKFDVIIFKSILGGIGRDGQYELQLKAIFEMYKALKKGGELWFAENLIGSPLHQYARKMFVNWGKSWRYLNIEEFKIMLKRFSKLRYQSIGFCAVFGRTEPQRSFLATFDHHIFNRIIPENWRYIFVGLATK